MNEHLVLIFIYLGANQQDEASAQECDLVQQQCGGTEFQEKSSVWFDSAKCIFKSVLLCSRDCFAVSSPATSYTSVYHPTDNQDAMTKVTFMVMEVGGSQ